MLKLQTLERAEASDASFAGDLLADPSKAGYIS